MLSNRSMPESIVIPELAYEDVAAAVTWLCTVLGFREHLRIADHRAQLTFPGGGWLVVTDGGAGNFATAERSHTVMVRVLDAAAHYQHAVRHGAQILHPPTDYSYGERQYSLRDPGGHRWVFSQSIADVDPSSWGGKLA
jgi:uncharacterized glyoxalase superfamily protein PhnB